MKRHDRGFRLNLVRRTGSGRAAEVWGRTAVPSDTAYRHLGPAAADRAAGVAAPADRRQQGEADAQESGS
jgi:penicillin amidase